MKTFENEICKDMYFDKNSTILSLTVCYDKYQNRIETVDVGLDNEIYVFNFYNDVQNNFYRRIQK